MTVESANTDHSRHESVAADYLPTLDGWRAVAILLVMMCHGGLFYFSAQGPHPSRSLQSFVGRGGVGVDIFFAISGFLICTRLLREQRKTASIDLRSFYIRRAFRILPPYLTYLAVISLFASAGWIIVEQNEMLTSLLFVRNYLAFPKSLQLNWYTGHFWSLAVEEHFYLLWPGLLLLLRRQRAARAAVAIIMAVTIWRTLDLPFAASFFAGRVFDHRTDTRLDSLVWGCVFAFIYTSETGFAWLKKWMNLLVWFIAAITLFELIPHPNALTATIRPPLFAAVVVGTVVNPQWRLGRILEDPRVRWIGRISYSLYIWQQLFLVWQLLPRPLPFGQWQEIPLAFVSIMVCALASYYVIELPSIRLGRRISLAYASASTASSSAIALIASAGSSA